MSYLNEEGRGYFHRMVRAEKKRDMYKDKMAELISELKGIMSEEENELTKFNADHDDTRSNQTRKFLLRLFSAGKIEIAELVVSKTETILNNEGEK